MRVLLISHTCQSRTEGQPKAHELAAIPGVSLRVLVPAVWKDYGKWREAQTPIDPQFEFAAERVRWPWVKGAQNYLHWYPGLRRILGEFRPDVIDLWEEPWGAVSAHACWLKKRLLPSAKIVSETEQNLNKRLPPPFEQFRRYTLGCADFVVGRNSEAIEVVRSKGYRGPAGVVPNAVDTALFRPMSREACRAELGVHGFVVGYAGRLVEEKGILDLINAVSECAASVTLLIIGGGPLEEEIRRSAELPNLKGRVLLLAPRVQSELPAVLNAMDVLVLPSHTTKRWKEQFGRVIIEAHACRIPVIGSNSGAIPDVVGAGGLIVEEASVAALRHAIEKLAVDPELAQRLSDAGLAQVRARYTWKQVAERMHEIYRQVYGDAQTPVA